MPFALMRPHIVNENSTTTKIEVNSVFDITVAGTTLTLNNAVYNGCFVYIVNSSGNSVYIAINGTETITLFDGESLDLEYVDRKWKRRSANKQGNIVSREDLVSGESDLATGVIYVCIDDVGNGIELRSMFVGDEDGKALEVFRRTLTPPSVEMPSASPNGGTFDAAQNVTLTCPTPGAQIRYTTDGSDPKTSGILYAGPIAVSQTTRLRAAATLNSVWSPELDKTYTIKVATPAASYANGTYIADSISVALSCATAGAQIRYTTNGADPTAGSALYSSPIAINESTTLKAKAFKAGLEDSDVLTKMYALKAATPTASQESFFFYDPASTDIYSNTDGVALLDALPI
jgi:hypothetical protein